jgi:hypothetical protein
MKGILRSTSIILTTLSLACSSSSAPKQLGALSGGIISGRVQTAVAGAQQLPAPVVEQVVRL